LRVYAEDGIRPRMAVSRFLPPCAQSHFFVHSISSPRIIRYIARSNRGGKHAAGETCDRTRPILGFAPFDSNEQIKSQLHRTIDSPAQLRSEVLASASRSLERSLQALRA
jgi:hypothetical protein